jgi:hypothetical protein
VCTYVALVAAGGALGALAAAHFNLTDAPFLTALPWAIPAFSGSCCAIVAGTGGIHWLSRWMSPAAGAPSHDHRDEHGAAMAPAE